MSDEIINEQPIEEITQQEGQAEASQEESEGIVNEAEANLDQVAKEALSKPITEQEAKEMIKELKLKVNGKEVVKKYKSDEELIRDLQLAEANKVGMQKYKELEKLFEQEARRLKDNPWEVLEELGHDPVKLAELRLEQWVKEQQKTPEQREYEKMQRELSEAREKLKRKEEEAELQKKQSLKQSAFQEIEKEINEALSSYTSLPNTRKTVSKIADALIWAMDNGFPEATVADILPVVEGEMISEFNEFFENAPDEAFEKYVGQKKLENYRKKRLGSLKSSSVPKNDVPKVTGKIAESRQREKIPMKDFFKNPEKYMKK